MLGSAMNRIAILLLALVIVLPVPIQQAAAEPPPPGERVGPYDWLAVHLPRYQELAAKPWPGPLPSVKKLSPGESWPGIAPLAEILRDLGDLPVDAPPAADGTYDGPLVEAVKKFQVRHGLTPDGIIGPASLAALNHPYTSRLAEIEAALAWLETIRPPAADAVVVVNIPSFQLHAWEAADRGKKATLSMPVVVGNAAKSRTPILGGEISYLVFRPYWYVPRSIIVKEMLPAYAKNRAYFEQHQLELTASNDDSKPGLPATAANVELLRAGKLGVRQKPGPRNALGKVKFIFPNSQSIYLHDTPSKSLFARDRRDFSHGCVRVSDPPALAAFLLRNEPAWDAAAITAAMEAERPKVVHVKPRVPVYLLYSTVFGTADGRIAFFDDVYRKGRPEGGPQQ
jgi:murein L,D-transpeptidase YcbB/YkuD